MADLRDAASTEDYWVFAPYNLEFRGANDVPARFRAQAQWEGHHSAGTGYYARSTHSNNPIAVKFNHDHLAWAEIRRDRNNNEWTAFRIAAGDLQLSIPLSTLTNEELQNILRTPEGEGSSEGSEESEESERPNLFRETQPSTPPSSPPQRVISIVNDTPERITIYHNEEVGLLAQRAESLTIDEASINATRTQEIPGCTIDPVTGHVPGANPADNLAIFRAFGPDQPDPPPGNGGGGGGGSGGRGGGGGGGVVEVAEERHHPDLEEQGKECLSLPTWTTNCMAKAPTSLQGTSRRPENLLPNGTFTGVSTSTWQ